MRRDPDEACDAKDEDEVLADDVGDDLPYPLDENGSLGACKGEYSGASTAGAGAPKSSDNCAGGARRVVAVASLSVTLPLSGIRLDSHGANRVFGGVDAERKPFKSWIAPSRTTSSTREHLRAPEDGIGVSDAYRAGPAQAYVRDPPAPGRRVQPPREDRQTSFRVIAESFSQQRSGGLSTRAMLQWSDRIRASDPAGILPDTARWRVLHTGSLRGVSATQSVA